MRSGGGGVAGVVGGGGSVGRGAYIQAIGAVSKKISLRRYLKDKVKRSRPGCMVDGETPSHRHVLSARSQLPDRAWTSSVQNSWQISPASVDPSHSSRTGTGSPGA